MNRPADVFERLMETIEQRAITMPENSYTTKLFLGGVAKIGEKIHEEAAEVVEAAGEGGDEGRTHLTHEVADLMFHTFVLMAHRGIRLDEIANELARREGTSGLEEKRQRGAKSDQQSGENL